MSDIFLDDDNLNNTLMSIAPIKLPTKTRNLFGRRRYFMGFIMKLSNGLNSRLTADNPITVEEKEILDKARNLIQSVIDNRQKNWEIHKNSIIENAKTK
jgi:hypothetical protein